MLVKLSDQVFLIINDHYSYDISVLLCAFMYIMIGVIVVLIFVLAVGADEYKEDTKSKNMLKYGVITLQMLVIRLSIPMF